MWRGRDAPAPLAALVALHPLVVRLLRCLLAVLVDLQLLHHPLDDSRDLALGLPRLCLCGKEKTLAAAHLEIAGAQIGLTAVLKLQPHPAIPAVEHGRLLALQRPSHDARCAEFPRRRHAHQGGRRGAMPRFLLCLRPPLGAARRLVRSRHCQCRLFWGGKNAEVRLSLPELGTGTECAVGHAPDANESRVGRLSLARRPKSQPLRLRLAPHLRGRDSRGLDLPKSPGVRRRRLRAENVARLDLISGSNVGAFTH